MHRTKAVSFLLIGIAIARTAFAAERSVPLAAANLEAPGLVVESVEHKGRRATRVTVAPGSRAESIAVVKGTDFKDGTLEIDLAGQPAAGAPEGARLRRPRLPKDLRPLRVHLSAAHQRPR